MIEAVLNCDTGSFNLVRPGASHKLPLQPWDAADSYLIEQVNQLPADTHTLLINDQFGALAVALSAKSDTIISDSACARDAIGLNLIRNEIAENHFQVFSTTEEWLWQTTPSIAAIKLPRNLSLLHFELARCWEYGITECWIAGMMKHLPKHLLSFLQGFGTVERLPFVKKATIFKVRLTQAPASEYPKEVTLNGFKFVTHANVFGRDKLDPGASLILDSIATLEPADDVADLCCGTGILGFSYLQHHPQAKVDFYDESFMAVETTVQSALLNNLNIGQALAMDGMSKTSQQYDLILCNPPFHEQNTVGDHIAKRLFNHAKNHLKPRGKFVLVGNRHLRYHVTLKKYFKHCQQLNADAKFVVFECHD